MFNENASTIQEVLIDLLNVSLGNDHLESCMTNITVENKTTILKVTDGRMRLGYKGVNFGAKSRI